MRCYCAIFSLVRKLLSFLFTILAITTVFYLMLAPLVRQMLYPAPPISVPSPPPPPLEEVILELPGGERTVAWSLRHAVANSPAVVFFHGNGENIETVRLSGLFDELAVLGAHVLAVEYPGYGRSTGEPSESSLVAAGEAGLAWIVERYPESKKIVLGWSLGAAVAIQTAANRTADVDGLVLMSAWADLRSVAAIHYPSWLVGMGLEDKYDSVAAAAKVRAPVLTVHGAADQIIPVEQGRRLHEALESSAQQQGSEALPRFVGVAGAGHNDLLARPEVWQELRAFLHPLKPASGTLP